MKYAITLFLLFSLAYLLISCHHNDEQISTTLYDKPLDVIKFNIQGRWKLKKVTGGICNCSNLPKNNPYMIINDRIVFGSDLGITVDTTIVWKRDMDIFRDSTYLLFYQKNTCKVVDRIENGALILYDNFADGFNYYYTR